MLEKPSPGMKLWDFLMNFVFLFRSGWMLNITTNRVSNLHNFVRCPVIYPVENVKMSLFFPKLTAVMIRSTEFDGLGKDFWEMNR